MSEYQYSLIEKYNNLNNSYKKKLVYRIGSGAGFFSEYNNMIYAILYCLKNKMKFILNSSDANFSYKKGWQDYFLPFCDEDKDRWHIKYNHRWVNSKPQNLKDLIGVYKVLFYCYKKNISYLTYDLFGLARSQNVHEYFSIPDLGINGDLLSACEVLVKMTWRYNDDTKFAIKEIVEAIPFTEDYIGFHIRRGDKIKEKDFYEISEYIKKAEDITLIRTAYVSTDDYGIIDELKEKYPKWNFKTLCKIDQKGYYEEVYEKMSKREKRSHIIEFFASVELLSNSLIFIGTFNSNVGAFLKMKRLEKKSYGVDFENWSIW